MSEHRHRLIQAGDWLRTQRTLAGVSVRDLAAVVGVSTQQVYDWQAGKHQPSDERAEQIADALGLDVITTRAGLGLWVPTGQAEPVAEYPDLTRIPLRVLYDELTRRIEAAAADDDVTGSDRTASGM